MKPPSDETRLRELIQQVRQADEQGVPDFDEILSRPRRQATRRSVRRVQIGIAAAMIGFFIVVSALVWAQRPKTDGDSNLHIADDTESAVDPDSQIPEMAAVDVDFDQIRRVVDQHFVSSNSTATQSRVWSSGTDSLLTMNVNPLVVLE